MNSSLVWSHNDATYLVSIYTSAEVTGTHTNLEKSGHRPCNCGRV